MAEKKSIPVSSDEQTIRQQHSEQVPHWRQYRQQIGMTFPTEVCSKARHGMWDLPAPEDGSYGGGCKTGKAFARAFVEWLRLRRGDTTGGVLQLLVHDLVKLGCDNEARSGQIVGFFCHLEKWLAQGAQFGNPLHQAQIDALVADATAGLSHTKEDDLAEIRAIQRDQRAAAAKLGWRRRRTKAKSRKLVRARRAPRHISAL